MVEDRERIQSLKQTMKISREEEINPYPFQMYQGDASLGAKPRTFLAAESPTFGWIDKFQTAVKIALMRALARGK